MKAPFASTQISRVLLGGDARRPAELLLVGSVIVPDLRAGQHRRRSQDHLESVESGLREHRLRGQPRPVYEVRQRLSSRSGQSSGVRGDARPRSADSGGSSRGTVRPVYYVGLTPLRPILLRRDQLPGDRPRGDDHAHRLKPSLLCPFIPGLPSAASLSEALPPSHSSCPLCLLSHFSPSSVVSSPTFLSHPHGFMVSSRASRPPFSLALHNPFRYICPSPELVSYLDD